MLSLIHYIQFTRWEPGNKRIQNDFISQAQGWRTAENTNAFSHFSEGGMTTR